jgi:hypothetical protein
MIQHDHPSPRQQLAQVLRDVFHAMQAVLGEASAYDTISDELTLPKRVELYKRGHDCIVSAERIVHEGLGGPKALPWVEEEPRSEAAMKREARRALQTVRSLEKRYGVSARSGTLTPERTSR